MPTWIGKIFSDIWQLADSSFRPRQRVASVTRYANRVRVVFQMALGLFIVGLIVWDAYGILFKGSAALKILEHIGEALAFSAAIDLAYMLFTPGPDEAIEPVIIGIAATVLILVSSFKELITGSAPRGHASESTGLEHIPHA